MAYLSMANPDVYRQAIRSGLSVWYHVDAYFGGVLVAGGLAPTGGSITDTTRPGVRRTLSVDFAPEPGLFDKLAPVGTQLKVWAHVRYTDQNIVDIPMGLFDVDSEKISDGGGGLSLTAPDKWVRIQRARFLWPTGPQPGLRVADQIVALIRDALGPSEPVSVLTDKRTTVDQLVWEKDRDKAILDLAAGIGVWVYFDRNGIATIQDVPVPGPDWLADASESGVLVELDRSRDRSKTCNVVVVSSSATDGEKFPTQMVWDDNPSSPTYAGTNPQFATDAGPFGIVPYFYETPLALDVDGARQTAFSILTRTAGLASQISLGQVPNPAVDAYDIINVLPPRERSDIPRVVEQHIGDTVTHPLTVGAAQTIEGRSTRTDEFTL